MSKGSKRREEDSAKIAENWNKIFNSPKETKQSLEDFKKLITGQEVPCIRARLEAKTDYEKASKIDYISCPCSKCSPFTL